MDKEALYNMSEKLKQKVDKYIPGLNHGKSELYYSKNDVEKELNSLRATILEKYNSNNLSNEEISQLLKDGNSLISKYEKLINDIEKSKETTEIGRAELDAISEIRKTLELAEDEYKKITNISNIPKNITEKFLPNYIDRVRREYSTSDIILRKNEIIAEISGKLNNYKYRSSIKDEILSKITQLDKKLENIQYLDYSKNYLLYKEKDETYANAVDRELHYISNDELKNEFLTIYNTKVNLLLDKEDVLVKANEIAKKLNINEIKPYFSPGTVGVGPFYWEEDSKSEILNIKNGINVKYAIKLHNIIYEYITTNYIENENINKNKEDKAYILSILNKIENNLPGIIELDKKISSSIIDEFNNSPYKNYSFKNAIKKIATEEYEFLTNTIFNENNIDDIESLLPEISKHIDEAIIQSEKEILKSTFESAITTNDVHSRFYELNDYMFDYSAEPVDGNFPLKDEYNTLPIATVGLEKLNKATTIEEINAIKEEELAILNKKQLNLLKGKVLFDLDNDLLNIKDKINNLDTISAIEKQKYKDKLDTNYSSYIEKINNSENTSYINEMKEFVLSTLESNYYSIINSYLTSEIEEPSDFANKTEDSIARVNTRLE